MNPMQNSSNPWQIVAKPTQTNSQANTKATQINATNAKQNKQIKSEQVKQRKAKKKQTNNILNIPLKRPHDIVIDPATGWIYALNPNSGHVFRFSAIGKNESMI